MTEHFVTLFDSFYLPQGLALYSSLSATVDDFCLWILCVDNNAYNFLNNLSLSNVKLLSLEHLETSSLIEAKLKRTRSEYCWTITPWSIYWVFQADSSIARVTYLDADTFFFKSPLIILDELAKSGRSFLLTAHAYSPFYDQTVTSGRYCVQFVPVVRSGGLPILLWWRDKCTEWCYARYENGLFGDQKYLESIPHLFPNDILDLGNDPRFLAPWNANYYRFSDCVLFHFQGFRVISSRFCILCSIYTLNETVRIYIYRHYLSIISSLPKTYPGLKLKSQVKITPMLCIRLFTSVLRSFLIYLF
jgi:hypothetical protein